MDARLDDAKIQQSADYKKSLGEAVRSRSIRPLWTSPCQSRLSRRLPVRLRLRGRHNETHVHVEQPSERVVIRREVHTEPPRQVDPGCEQLRPQ